MLHVIQFMRDWSYTRRLAIIGIVVLAYAGVGTVAGLTASQTADDIPITVETNYTGTSPESTNSVILTVKIRPQERTLRSTRVVIDPTSQAFLSTSPVEIREATTDGRQVVQSLNGTTRGFQIGTLRPGESVAIQLALYPKAKLPNGDRLATVNIKTQFDENSREVNYSTPIDPNITPDPDGESGLRSLLVLPAGVGLLVGGIAGSIGGYVYFRWRLNGITVRIRKIAEDATPRVQRRLEEEMERLDGQVPVDSEDDVERLDGQAPVDSEDDGSSEAERNGTDDIEFHIQDDD